jgi:hypothetical protein
VFFARGISPTKNGDKLYWEKKFHAINGKAQTCIQGALFFFLLSLVEGEGEVEAEEVSKGFNLSMTKEVEGSICTLLFKKCY